MAENADDKKYDLAPEVEAKFEETFYDMLCDLALVANEYKEKFEQLVADEDVRYVWVFDFLKYEKITELLTDAALTTKEDVEKMLNEITEIEEEK